MWEYTRLMADGRDWTAEEKGVSDGFMRLRLAYVTAMGWLPAAASDADRYDGDPATVHLVRLDDGEGDPAERLVRAGMRLTRVPSLFESLTWSMLSADPGRQADIVAGNFAVVKDLNARAADPGAGLWDITRLVAPVDGSIGAATVVKSIFELIGMAMFQTVAEPQADPSWLFLTTATMKRLFDSAGVEAAVLWSGRVSGGDDYDCHLCVARPREAFRHLVAAVGAAGPRRAHCRVLDGLAALAGRELVAAV